MPLIKEMSNDVKNGRAIEWLQFLLRNQFGDSYHIEVISPTQFTATYIGKDSMIAIFTYKDIEVTDIDFERRIIYYKILRSENN